MYVIREAEPEPEPAGPSRTLVSFKWLAYGIKCCINDCGVYPSNNNRGEVFRRFLLASDCGISLLYRRLPWNYYFPKTGRMLWSDEDHVSK